MNVIFIAMEFAPVNSAGIYRPIRFINAMANEGINPIVVTFEVDENLKKVQSNFDKKLLELIHPSVKIVRVPIDDITLLISSSFGRFRFIMNNAAGDNFYNGWKSKIFRVMDKLMMEYAPKVIITTSPPFSSAILGRDISKKYHLPFILDMRDAWSEWAMVPQASYFHYLRKKLMERSVFNQATKIISVTPQLIKKFQSAHPKITSDKFELIYNSPNFPVDDNFSVTLKNIQEADRIDVGYTGSFYYTKKLAKKKPHQLFQYFPNHEDWLYRTPYFFLKTLKALFFKRPEWADKIYFNYIGNQGSELSEMVADFGLEKNVIIHGHLSYKMVKELESKFDVLLTTAEKVSGSEHYCLPSKLFTYLLAKKPIIGFLTKGVQNDFIQQIGIGLSFNPDDTSENVLKLETLFENGWSGKMDSSFFQKFHQETTNEKFVNIVRVIGD